MYRVPVRLDDLLRSLADLDRRQALETKSGGCPCGGPLHDATWQRKPRGVDLPEALCTRWGLCCGKCRKRKLPPSVLFAGRRVYLKAVMLLVVAARQRDRANTSMSRLRRLFGVSTKTIGRWVRAFLEGLSLAPQWLRVRGRIPATVRDVDVPSALLALHADAMQALRLACVLVPDL